ncbi:MAG: hypothetical protein AAFY29_09660 [Pseudomonadota bacterium]
MLKLFKGLRGCAFVVLASTVGSSASADSDIPRKQEAQLVDRVEARWEALGNSDYVATYDFQSPSYRAVFTQEMYASQFSSTLERRLTSVEILNYDAAAAVASVAVGVMSRPVKQTSAASAAIQAKPVIVVEQWILRNNEWWFSVVK